LSLTKSAYRIVPLSDTEEEGGQEFQHRFRKRGRPSRNCVVVESDSDDKTQSDCILLTTPEFTTSFHTSDNAIQPSLSSPPLPSPTSNGPPKQVFASSSKPGLSNSTTAQQQSLGAFFKKLTPAEAAGQRKHEHERSRAHIIAAQKREELRREVQKQVKADSNKRRQQEWRNRQKVEKEKRGKKLGKSKGTGAHVKAVSFTMLLHTPKLTVCNFRGFLATPLNIWRYLT
jgi:hypothetical protein